MSSLAESPFIQQQLQSREWMREQQEEHKAYAAYVFHPLHQLKQRTCRVRVHASVPQNTNKRTRVFFVQRLAAVALDPNWRTDAHVDLLSYIEHTRTLKKKKKANEHNKHKTFQECLLAPDAALSAGGFLLARICTCNQKTTCSALMRRRVVPQNWPPGLCFRDAQSETFPPRRAQKKRPFGTRTTSARLSASTLRLRFACCCASGAQMIAFAGTALPAEAPMLRPTQRVSSSPGSGVLEIFSVCFLHKPSSRPTMRCCHA